MKNLESSSWPIATLDLETDPFLYARLPVPFCAGIQLADQYISVWDETNVIARTVEILEKIETPHVIYAHNGGKFDWLFFLKYLAPDMQVINGRIVRAFIGKHEIRDSFSIMPFPLAKYKKDDIAYEKLERAVRNEHRSEILKYLQSDCVALFELVTSYRARFGDSLTVGSTAMREIKKRHKYEAVSQGFDERLRSEYYFGGRNECFQGGVLKGDWKIYDVNSMYPYVMATHLHPISRGIHVSKYIEENTCFLEVEGWNYGALPTRKKNGGLDFQRPYGTFFTTIHEYLAAIETERFKVKKIKKTLGFSKRGVFDMFVNDFFELRKEAKRTNDKIGELLYKFVLNSGYGKFAQDPDNYFDWRILPSTEKRPNDPCEKCKPDQGYEIAADCEYCFGTGYRWHMMGDELEFTIWRAQLQSSRYYNVATGCSITGAARAVLMRGLAAAKNPVYCDTDSIICESLNMHLNDTELGAWKLEATGDRVALCGKKTYALMNGDACVKKAHKGARLTAENIFHIARGGTVRYKGIAPSMSINGSYQFIDRKIKATHADIRVY